MSEPADLAYLCHHYGEAYDGTVLTADSADALLDLIRADYAVHPVSRQIAGADRP